MTSRPFTDEQLTAGLRAHLPVANAALHERIRAELTTTPQERQLPSILGRLTDADPVVRRRMILLAALAGLALMVSVAGAAGALLREQRTPDLSVVPPPDATLGIDTAPTIVESWPDTNLNAPGLYSWDGFHCPPERSCTVGFMHNGYGSGDVEIRVKATTPSAMNKDDATPASVAGHDGIYRRIDSRQEEWVVVIEGTPVIIRIVAEPGTSKADLADAHAIIASMYTERTDSPFGFRLVFRLTNHEWDSG